MTDTKTSTPPQAVPATAKAATEPHTSAPQSPVSPEQRSNTTPRGSDKKDPSNGSPTQLSDDFLSPVSKYERAQHYAALEQQKRLDAVASELVRKQKLLKRKELEERIEQHLGKKAKRLIPDPATAAEVTQSVAQSIATSLLDQFNDEDDDSESENIQQNVRRQIALQELRAVSGKDEASYSVDLASVSKLSSLDTIEGDDITRELLRQTRNKLDRIMASSVSNQSSPVSTGQPRSNARNDASPSTNDDGSWDGRPLTNYHLQQMGLVKEKVNIYAPLEEQKRQIRQVLAQQYQQPTKQHGHNVLPSHQTLAAKRRLDSDASTTDSDYIPSESGMDTGSTALSDDTEDSTTNNSTASDSDSESTQLVRSHVMFDSWFVWLPVYLLSFCVLVLALLLAVDTADERYHFCQLTPDTAVSLSSTSEGIAQYGCQAVAQVHTFLQLIRDLIFQQ